MKLTKRRKDHISKTLIDFGKLAGATLVLSQFVGEKRFNLGLFVIGTGVALILIVCGLLVDDTEE